MIEIEINQKAHEFLSLKVLKPITLSLKHFKNGIYEIIDYDKQNLFKHLILNLRKKDKRILLLSLFVKIPELMLKEYMKECRLLYSNVLLRVLFLRQLKN